MNYTLARNVIIYDELGRILSALGKSDGKVIVLAGAALGATVYDNIGQRPMGDIDLLIRHQDRQRIGELLENLGYVLDTARSDEAHYSKTLDTFTLHIDCHTDLKHYLDDRALAGVWNRARLVTLYQEGSGVCCPLKFPHPHFAKGEKWGLEDRIGFWVLSPEDTLIYTAVDSAIYHGRITVNTLKDMELIIKHYDLNWLVIVQRIKSCRLETPLAILFDLCRKKGVPIPVQVSNVLNPRKRSLEYIAYRLLLASDIRHQESHEDATRVTRFLFRPVARWELFMNSFFPSRHFIEQQHSPEAIRYRVSGTLYLIRTFAVIWRMNKAMYQLALKML